MSLDTSKTVVVIESSDRNEFESQCNFYISHGYVMHSSHCGFLDSEEYNFCSSFQAVLVKRFATTIDKA